MTGKVEYVVSFGDDRGSRFVRLAMAEAGCHGAELGEKVVRCRDCARSRVERHTGDDVLVCWKRKSHGEAVPDDGFCHDGAGKGGGR